MEYDHMEFPEAVRELADMVGMEVPVETGGIHSCQHPGAAL